MFSGLNNLFRKVLPKRLFYRALLIVAVPVIVLQLVITIVFFDSLWIKTNKGMTRTLVNEISAFIEAYESEKVDKQEINNLFSLFLDLNIELKQKEPKLEKMDASISKLDGAMSPVFILKQVMIEQSSLMNSLDDFKLNFNSKSSQDLEPIINDLKKFEDKLSQLNEILEKQEDYQEEKFLSQKNDLLKLSGEITSLKVKIATISRDIASIDEQEHLVREAFESNTNQLKELEQPIFELEKEMKPLLDSRANVEDDLTNRRSKFAEISEEIRQCERRSHEVDISIEKIRTDSQDSKVTRQGYLSEAEIYLKQLEKDDFVLEDLLK